MTMDKILTEAMGACMHESDRLQQTTFAQFCSHDVKVQWGTELHNGTPLKHNFDLPSDNFT